MAIEVICQCGKTLSVTIAVCFWLSLAAGNQLAANQRSYKLTEEDIQREKEMDRLEQQMKEVEKVLEKHKKQDEDLTKRIAEEDEARRTRKMWGRLICGGLFVVLTLGFQMFKRRGRNAPDRSSRSSRGDSSPRNLEDAGQSAEPQIGAEQKTEQIPTHRKSLVYRMGFNSGKQISIVVDHTSNVIHFENCYSRSRYFRFSPEQHFFCPVSDVTSYHTYHLKNKGTYLVLKTRTGTAQVLTKGDSFADFYDAMHHEFPGKACAFHEDSSLAMFLFLMAAFAAWYIGRGLIPALASNAVHFSIIVPLVVVSVLSVYLWVDWLGRK